MRNTPRILTAGLLAAALTLGGCAASEADTGHDDGGTARPLDHWLASLGSHAGDRQRTRPAADPRYQEECGSCHFAYPPGLLDRAGWTRIFATLGDHFGDDATLDPTAARHLEGYVLAHAGQDDRSRSTPAQPRITTTRWFVREHDEVPARLVAGNPAVGSLANCTACHGDAQGGDFRERAIRIPGHGRWDD